MHPKIRWAILALALFIVLGTLIPRRKMPGQIDPLYAAEVLNLRKQKDAFLRGDSNSPLLPTDRLHFLGLTYYPLTQEYRLNATFKPAADGAMFGDNLAKPVGILEFSFEGRTYTLRAFHETGTDKQRLFVPFHDRTNGKDTYGGGRYLAVLLTQGSREVVLDFNTAYHPYCAYNPAYVCPVVPPENRLPFSITAGEKGYAEQVD